MRHTKWLSLLFYVIFLIGCLQEQEPKNNLIIGRWELEEAKRNGQTTELLDGIFFEFFEDGSLKSNFNASLEEQLSKYKINGEDLQQTESEENLNYNIGELSDSVLVIKTQFQGARYQMLLKKRNQEG